MKKYLNKILAATLTLCMSLTLLTACGSSSSDGSSSDGAAVSRRESHLAPAKQLFSGLP